MKDQEKMITEIRYRIREGQKTSYIVGVTGFPLELIKQVKSEEMANDARIAREKEKADQEQHMENKRKLHEEAFLKRMGYDPTAKIFPDANDSTTAGTEQTTVVVQAPALGANVESQGQAEDANIGSAQSEG